jgi:type II secretory pathway predicted ATPase ExeA
VRPDRLRSDQDPFDISSGKAFYYFDAARRQTSARLIAGMLQGHGLFFLTGPSGIGKTTVLYHLADQLKALDGIRLLEPPSVYSCRADSDLTNILKMCNEDGRSGASATEPPQSVQALQSMSEHGQIAALLLDDADLLADDICKALAALSMPHAGDRRLLSIVMAGTPELARKIPAVPYETNGFASERNFELQPMSEADVGQFIRHRLRVAGHSLSRASNPSVIASIAQHSSGIPRAILDLCRRTWQIADARSAQTLTVEMVAEAVASPEMASAAAPHAANATTVSIGTRTAEIIGGPARKRPSATSPAPVPATDTPISAHPELGLLREPSGPIPGRWSDSGELSPGVVLTDERRRRTWPASRSTKWALDVGAACALLIAVGLRLFAPDEDTIAGAPKASSVGDTKEAAGETADAWWRPRLQETPTGDTPALATTVPAGTLTEPDTSLAKLKAPEIEATDPSVADVNAPPARVAPPVAAPPVATPPAATAPASTEPMPPESNELAMASILAASPMPRPDIKPLPPVANSPLPNQPTPDHAAAAKQQVNSLLSDGDEFLQQGDVAAARSAYRAASEKGSTEGAVRMAQTFDPRKVSARARSSSPREAILWYQDAARRGERRAKAELNELERWLERAAASGNVDARRTLDLWRAPPEPAPR